MYCSILFCGLRNTTCAVNAYNISNHCLATKYKLCFVPLCGIQNTNKRAINVDNI